MNANNKFLFLKLKERNGNYEYLHHSVHPIKDKRPFCINKFIKDYISDFYGGEAKRADDGYYFYNGEVYVEEYSRKYINEEHYNILSQYL